MSLSALQNYLAPNIFNLKLLIVFCCKKSNTKGLSRENFININKIFSEQF